MKKRIASGSVFQRVYRDKRTGELKKTRVWYAKYYVNGKPITVPTETEDYDEAVEFLRKKMAETATLRTGADRPERVKMDQLFDLLLEWYAMRERRTLYDVKRKIEKKNGLRAWFGRLKATAVNTSAIAGFIAWRRRQKPRPANGTINRELAYVRRALNLGEQHDPPLVLHVPKFEMLPEADPRDGVVTHAQYKSVRDALPGYARIALVIGYHAGARKGEITAIRKDWVDLKSCRIEIRTRDASTKKHKRFLPIYGDMAAELEMAIAAGDKRCPYLVQVVDKDGRGARVIDFEKAWSTACELAGIPDALFHDLRRTALTNMIEAGFSEKEAMEFSGHRTRAVFDRYHIVSARRLKEQAARLGEHMKAKAAAEEKESAPGVIQ